MLGEWSWETEATLDSLRIVESLLLSIGSELGFIAIRICICCLSVGSIVTWLVLINYGAKTGIWSLDWAIDERQLGYVVFVNHIQYWSLLDFVDLWVLKLSLLDRLLLIETIRWYELTRIMLGNSMQSIQWLRQPRRCQTVN